jgi:cell filamentation protein
MATYQREVLDSHTPCKGMDDTRLVRALAISHAELILIHPFREGNGRLARLLNTLMALQAGLPALDYGGIRGRARREYIAAIHAALDRNYAPMERVFRAVVRRTLRGAA